MNAAWSIRILFASALVLAYVGGEWHGRRSPSTHLEATPVGLATVPTATGLVYSEVCTRVDAAGIVVSEPCEPWPDAACRVELGDSIGWETTSPTRKRVWVERDGKTVCKGRGFE